MDQSNAWRFTAAISGAHTLGQARISNSGFNGHWSDLANQGKFNNDYYRSLLLKGWGPELSINGNQHKNQWKRIDRDVESNGHHELMLNSDMCLAYMNQRSDNFLSAASANSCCGWTDRNILFDKNVLISGQNNDFCGITISENRGRQRGNCCRDQSGTQGEDQDCDDKDDPEGPAIDAVMEFAASESSFLDGYTQAWWLATENGVHEPTFDCKPPVPANAVSEEIGILNNRLCWSILLVSISLLYVV